MDRRVQIAGAIERHPVRVVAGVGLVVVAVHLWWIATQRPLGAYNPDEAGYLVDALQYQRALTDGLLGGGRPSLGLLWERVGETTTGPLVPLASAPFLVVGSRSVWWAMVVQPLFHLAAAVAATGIARQVSTSKRAVVAGIAVLAMPGAMLAGRSYVYAGALASILALAVWMLLRSERGARTGAMVAFGALVGAALLTRTMAAAFLPAVVLAATLHVAPSRRARRNLALAGLAVVVVAGPWWLAAWSDVVRYLVDYGYSELADPYAASGIDGRLAQRFGVLLLDVRPLLLLPVLALLASAGVRWVAGHRASRREGRSTARATVDHDRRTVLIVVLGGYAALLTSGNTGIWFELPLTILAVPLVATVSMPSSTRVRRGLAGASAVAMVANLVLVGHLRLGAERLFRSGDQTLSAAGFLFGDQYQPPTAIRTPDPLLLSDPGDREREAARWWTAHRALLEVLDDARSETGLLRQTVTGSGPLMNLNSIELAQELEAAPATASSAVDSTAADLSAWLRVESAVPHVLIVVEGHSEPFPIDRDWGRVRAEAEESGWTPMGAVPLPDGGRALVLIDGARG